MVEERLEGPPTAILIMVGHSDKHLALLYRSQKLTWILLQMKKCDICENVTL